MSALDRNIQKLKDHLLRFRDVGILNRIDGQDRPGSLGTFPSTSPVDKSVICDVAHGTADDIDAAAKAATENLSQTLAEELENTSKIRVNTINPGATRTDMRALAYPGEDAEKLKTPEQIVASYLYLLGPEGAAINGQSLDAQPR